MLRIEDTDSARCRPEWSASLLDDLDWLGFRWHGHLRRQSDHLADYAMTLEHLARRGVLYPCSCTRRQIADAGARAGLDGLVYPGTCRGRRMETAEPGDALRLDVATAIKLTGPLTPFVELGPLHAGTHMTDPDLLVHQIGDPVLRRKDSGDPAYHLACCHDDAVQKVSHVIRGVDLWHATQLHVLLQVLMGWPVPCYYHHDLVRDASGRRLAKIDRSKAIAKYRQDGVSAAQIYAMLPPLPSQSL